MHFSVLPSQPLHSPNSYLTGKRYSTTLEAALSLFSRLGETLKTVNAVQLRELMSRTIERGEVWSTKRNRVSQLDRGVIYLRGDQWNNLTLFVTVHARAFLVTGWERECCAVRVSFDPFKNRSKSSSN